MTRVNWGTLASNVGMHMKIFMLGWPPRTAPPTSSTMAGLGETMMVWKNTSAIACRATTACSARTRSAMLSHGSTYDMLPTLVIPPASAACDPLV